MLRKIGTYTRVDPVANLPGYWVFQIAGWLAFALLSILSLNVWYNPGELAPALHSVVQSLIGIFISHPLRAVARRTWNIPSLPRIAINAAAILAASQIWTVLRLIAFTNMTGLPIGAEDWGGWIFGSLTVFGSWAFCYHAIKYYRQWLEAHELSIKAQNATLAAEALAERENAKRLQAEGLAHEAKLRMLNYQLNPHFLFNALNSVTALVKRDDQDGAVEMLSRISEFLRASLEESETFQHQLRDEIEIIEHYLAIEKVRFGDRLDVVFDISNAAADVEIPSLLLQPLIENNIKHAVGKSLSRTTIRIKASVEDGRLCINLSDSGAHDVRKKPATTTPSPGIGLKNVEERLQSVYGEDYDFHTTRSEDGGYHASINIPVFVNARPKDDLEPADTLL